MRISHRRGALTTLAVAGFLGLAISSPSRAATFNLTADDGTVTMPDGRVVPVWGFALGAGPVTVPGPRLVLPPGDTTLTINLTNNLSVPVSIVVPGVPKPIALAPVYDGGSPPRVLSFDDEADPLGGTASYTFSPVRPGTFLYESGSDPSVQVQMGLYGDIIARPTNAAQAYNSAATAFDTEIVMVLSEIDPAFHDAVAGGCYAPHGPTSPSCTTVYTSTNDHVPKYFLINGRPYSDPYTPFAGGAAGSTLLLRLANAGLRTHTMTLQGTRMDIIAQDGYLLTHARRDRVSELVAAGQTLDVLIRPPVAGKYAFFDRGLNVTNAGVFPGGLTAFIEVGSAPCDPGGLAPAGVPSVLVGKPAAGSARLYWNAIALATGYDIVRGGMTSLLATNGNFTVSTDACLGNDAPLAPVDDPTASPPGDGFWYLIRPVNCAGPGTYDSGAPSQSGSRDAEIQASAFACP